MLSSPAPPTSSLTPLKPSLKPPLTLPEKPPSETPESATTSAADEPEKSMAPLPSPLPVTRTLPPKVAPPSLRILAKPRDKDAVPLATKLPLPKSMLSPADRNKTFSLQDTETPGPTTMSSPPPPASLVAMVTLAAPSKDCIWASVKVSMPSPTQPKEPAAHILTVPGSSNRCPARPAGARKSAEPRINK